MLDELTGCTRIAGERVTLGLRQIAVTVTQIEGEHLPGEAEADVPGIVVGVGDALGLFVPQPDPGAPLRQP